MLFLNFSSEDFDAFKSKYHDAAVSFKGFGFRFLLGDVEASKNAFQVKISLARLLCHFLVKTSYSIDTILSPSGLD